MSKKSGMVKLAMIFAALCLISCIINSATAPGILIGKGKVKKDDGDDIEFKDLIGNIVGSSFCIALLGLGITYVLDKQGSSAGGDSGDSN
jgi:hypothetical protein